MQTRPTPVHQLGTILSIWAHPDDETYLAGGIMAAARANGQRVVCVSATAGEHGTNDASVWPPARLGQVRRWEAAAAMAVLGVDEHRFLDYEDGTLPHDDTTGIDAIGRLIDEVRPDTILTFGLDGMTYHPDHIAIHHWVIAAWERLGHPGNVYCATTSVEFLTEFRDLFEEWNMYMSDQRPLGIPADQLDIHLCLTGSDLDRKLTALRAMNTQTSVVMAMVEPDVYAAQVAEEWFIAANTNDGSRARSGSVPFARLATHG